jgi:hypothetical protein
LRLRIWSDRDYVPDGLPHLSVLSPFWGIDAAGETADNVGRFDQYRAVGTTIFELTSLDRADLAILPFNWEYVNWTDAPFYPASRDLAFAFVERARASDLPVAIFYETDLMRPVPIRDALVFGPSVVRSQRDGRTFAIPGWTDDLLAKYREGALSIRSKRDRPSVGFCGFAPPLGLPVGKEKLKEALRWALTRTGAIRYAPAEPGPFARVEAIRRLRRSPRIETDFIIRPYVVRPNRPSHEAGGAMHGAPGGMSTATAREVGTAPSHTQLEFLDNMLGNDYVLCARGFGNYSYRLYEALSCGRIPLFVDTDSALPYDREIDWRRHCVWVDQADLAHIGEVVSDFHSSITSTEFEERQRACRKLWEDWVSPEGFFRNLHRHLAYTGTPKEEST